MEMEDRNSCSRKRKPPIIDWASIFADSSSDDDDRPAEQMVTPAKKSKVGGTGEGLQQPQEEDLDVRKRTDKSNDGCSHAGTQYDFPIKVVKKDSRIVVNGLSTKSAPSKCPSPLSEDSDKLKTSSADQRGSHSATSSPHCSVGDIPGSSSDSLQCTEKNDNQNSLAPPESGKCLLKKLEEDEDSRIVVNGLSTKSVPFKCPSPLSEDSDELITSNADKKGSHSATSSPHCSVGDVPGSSSETNASQEDDLDKDEVAISVPEAKEQSKNEAIPENKKRVSGNLPTLLDDDVKNLFGNILEAINTFGDRVVAALERSHERVYSGDEIYAMVEEMSLESPLKERAYLWLMTREKAIKSLFGAPLEKRKSLLIMMMTDSSYQ